MNPTEVARKYTRRVKMKQRSPHLTWFGQPKRAYSTTEAAVQARDRMTEVTGHIFDIYLCPHVNDGEHLHVGHGVQRNRDLSVTRQEALYLELGERVLAQIKAENGRSRADRFRHLRKRMRSVYRLAMRDWIAPPRMLP